MNNYQVGDRVRVRFRHRDLNGETLPDYLQREEFEVTHEFRTKTDTAYTIKHKTGRIFKFKDADIKLASID